MLSYRDVAIDDVVQREKFSRASVSRLNFCLRPTFFSSFSPLRRRRHRRLSLSLPCLFKCARYPKRGSRSSRQSWAIIRNFRSWDEEAFEELIGRDNTFLLGANASTWFLIPWNGLSRDFFVFHGILVYLEYQGAKHTRSVITGPFASVEVLSEASDCRNPVMKASLKRRAKRRIAENDFLEFLCV